MIYSNTKELKCQTMTSLASKTSKHNDDQTTCMLKKKLKDTDVINWLNWHKRQSDGETSTIFTHFLLVINTCLACLSMQGQI